MKRLLEDFSARFVGRRQPSFTGRDGVKACAGTGDRADLECTKRVALARRERRRSPKDFIAEYEPKGGGNAFLRKFKSWYQRLKALSAGLMPVLYAPTIIVERLILVLEAPAEQSVKKYREGTQLPTP